MVPRDFSRGAMEFTGMEQNFQFFKEFHTARGIFQVGHAMLVLSTFM